MFGGQTALARLIKKSQSTIQGWEQRGIIPIHAIPIVRAAAREHLKTDIPLETFMPQDAA